MPLRRWTGRRVTGVDTSEWRGRPIQGSKSQRTMATAAAPFQAMDPVIVRFAKRLFLAFSSRAPINTVKTARRLSGPQMWRSQELPCPWNARWCAGRGIRPAAGFFVDLLGDRDVLGRGRCLLYGRYRINIHRWRFTCAIPGVETNEKTTDYGRFQSSPPAALGKPGINDSAPGTVTPKPRPSGTSTVGPDTSSS